MLLLLYFLVFVLFGLFVQERRAPVAAADDDNSIESKQSGSPKIGPIAPPPRNGEVEEFPMLEDMLAVD